MGSQVASISNHRANVSRSHGEARRAVCPVPRAFRGHVQHVRRPLPRFSASSGYPMPRMQHGCLSVRRPRLCSPCGRVFGKEGDFALWLGGRNAELTRDINPRSSGECWAFATKQPWAREKAHKTKGGPKVRYRRLPESKHSGKKGSRVRVRSR